MAVPRQQAFFGVQALRGLAATMVVVHHATGIWNSDFVNPNLVRFWVNGAAGVDIFFVISGFVMAYSSTGERRPSPGKFFSRRLLRIVPMYWLVTFLSAAKMLAVRLHPDMGSTVDHARLTLPFLASSLFFLPFRTSIGDVQTVLAVGWTLNFEMLFYLLFALALVLELRARVPLLVSLSAAILPLAIVGLFRQPSWPAIFTLLDPLLLEFLTGVVLGVLVRRGLRVATVPAALLATVGFIGLFTLPANVPGLRECVWGVAALALVSGTVLLEPVLGNAIPALILRIGDASYSLYLVHMLLIFALGRVILKLSHTVPPEWLFVLGSTLVCTITALLLYRLVERPMTLALGRWTSVGSARSIVGTEHLKPIG